MKKVNRNAYDVQKPIPGPGHRPKSRGGPDYKPLPMVTGNNNDRPQGKPVVDMWSGKTVKANRWLGNDDGDEGTE